MDQLSPKIDAHFKSDNKNIHTYHFILKMLKIQNKQSFHRCLMITFFEPQNNQKISTEIQYFPNFKIKYFESKRAVFLNRVPTNFSRCSAKSQNIEESVQKPYIFIIMVPILPFRCAANFFFKTSVLKAQKG
jgi:hypothetical protein